MKGIGKDFILWMIVAIVGGLVLILIVAPMIQNLSAQSQTCGAFRNVITDLSGGAAELC